VSVPGTKVALTFERFRREHSRLHDPEVLQSSYELVASEPAAHAAGRKAVEADAGGRGRRVAVPSEGAFEVAPKIYAHTSHVSCHVPLFGDRRFEFSAPDCQQVELLWGSASSGNPARCHRAQMDRERGGEFIAVVGVEDGEYLFAFSADGCVRPDPRHAQRITLTSEGPFAPLRLSRNTLLLGLENCGEAEELVRLEANAPWLASCEWVRLAPGATASGALRVLPWLMPHGECVAQVRARTDEPTSGAEYGAISVKVHAEASGAVPALSVTPDGLGWITQGRGQVEVGVLVEASGRGPLSGMLMLRHLDQVADFRLDASDGPTRFEHTFKIDSARLPYRAEGALLVTLVTDSYLANYRQLQAEVSYRLLYLKKSLPALSYGRLRKGTTRTLRLEVVRSDEQEVDLQVSVPDTAVSCLEVYRVSSSVYSFRFDTRGVAPGCALNETVELTDRLSGVSDRVKVLAEVER
jgi:hypothetical protein